MNDVDTFISETSDAFWVGEDGSLVCLTADEILLKLEEGQLSTETLVRIQPDAVAKPVARYLRELVWMAHRQHTGDSLAVKKNSSFEVAFQQAPIGMVLSDLAGRIVHTNQVFCDMLGYEHDELCSMRVSELCDPADREREVMLGNELLAGRRDNFQIEKGFHHRSGRNLQTITSIAAIRDEDGTPVQVIAHVLDTTPLKDLAKENLFLARDVSERVELERKLRLRTEELDASLADLKRTQKELVQREKLSALGTLVAGVAHEVNTPLGVALTALSLADEALQAMRTALASPTPSRRTIQARMDELDESMRLALQNGRRAATLVADFKKVAVDQASEALREIDLEAYLQSILSSLSPMLRMENVVVLTDLSPIQLQTRPGAIAQVVSNLIQNVVTHAFPDAATERQLWIRCARVGGMAQIEIEDRGAGIDPVTLKAVFDPFVTTRMGGGGSGLGMYVVHNLVVEMLNGTVEVESEQGRGTRVRVWVPLTPKA